MPGVTVTDALLDVWHQNTPPSDAPDRTLDGVTLDSVSIDSRAQDVMDEATIDISKTGVAVPDVCRVGDRVQFNATLHERGGSTRQIQWMGRIKPVTNQRRNVNPGMIATDATDFCGSILSSRMITGAYVNKDVGAIIRDIISKKASEVDGSGVADLGVSTDEFFDATDSWDAIVALAARGDALIRQDGTQLLIDPIENLPFAFDLAPEDYLLPWETKTVDDIKNVVRVDAGTNRKEEASQETQTAYERVTESSRITHQLRARKSEIHSVDLWTRQVSSDDDLNVRLQADEGGSPVAINDEDSDIENAQWSGSDVSTDDWTAVFFPTHTLPDRDPWMIIEAGGSEGHDIGIDDNTGEPTYRSFYPHPLTYEATDTESIAEYGSREISVDRDNLETIQAAQDAVDQELARRAWPKKTIKFEAVSPRAHALEPGDRIGVDNPSEDAVGEFVVLESSHTFDGGTIQLDTSITASWRKGILAP